MPKSSEAQFLLFLKSFKLFHSEHNNNNSWEFLGLTDCLSCHDAHNMLRFLLNEYFCLLNRKENKIRFHMSSVLSPEPKHVTANTHQKILKKLPTEWLIYEEMTRAHRLAQVRNIGCAFYFTISVVMSTDLSVPFKMSKITYNLKTSAFRVFCLNM